MKHLRSKRSFFSKYSRVLRKLLFRAISSTRITGREPTEQYGDRSRPVLMMEVAFEGKITKIHSSSSAFEWK